MLIKAAGSWTFTYIFISSLMWYLDLLASRFLFPLDETDECLKITSSLNVIYWPVKTELEPNLLPPVQLAHLTA